MYDVLVGIHQYTDEELRNNVKIYIGESNVPLKIESYKSLIPYYPYIIRASYHNNETKNAIISLSSESFVDREERELLKFYREQLIKIYNRCKRTKIEFDVDMAVKEVCWTTNKEEIRELATRIKKNGKKAAIDDIHLSIHEYYRQALVDEMIANGLNPVDYGYGRFIKDGNCIESFKE